MWEYVLESERMCGCMGAKECIEAYEGWEHSGVMDHDDCVEGGGLSVCAGGRCNGLVLMGSREHR